MSPIYSGNATGAFGGTITFDWVPDPEVVAAEIIQTAENLEDRSSPLALSRQIAIGDMRERFMTETSPGGDAWAPWADSYKPYAEGINAGILRRSGALYGAATSEGAYPITADSVFFSTAGLPEYWIYHQTGALRTAGASREEAEAHVEFIRSLGSEFVPGGAGTGINVLPARPFVGLSFEAELQILEVFDQWFAGAVAIGATSTGRLGRRHALRGPGGQFISREA